MIDDHLEATPCPNGCPKDDEYVLAGRDRLYGVPGEFRVVRCRACQLLRTEPRPTPAAMGSYYPANYGPYLGTRVATPEGGGSPSRRQDGPLRRAYRTIFRYRTTALPPLAPGRMLEIGCASGAFLKAMAERGWHVQGIEFSEAAAADARRLGFQVHAGPLEEAPPPDAAVDLIVGWMVLEHLHRPAAALRKLWSWAAPGAWLALSVPNAASLDFLLFRGSSYALQLPTHLYHFTPQTLTTMLGHHGWRVTAVLHQRTLANWFGSVALELEVRRAPGWLTRWLRGVASRPRLSSPILYPLAWALAAVGHTGRMTIWARREEALPAQLPGRP